MRQNCCTDGNDKPLEEEMPEWSDLPEIPLDERPVEDYNDRRIKELKKVPKIIIEEGKNKIGKVWN